MIFGVERRMFFLAAVSGVMAYELFGSMILGVAVFFSTSVLARIITREDPQMVSVFLAAMRQSAIYDPGKR